MKTSEIWYSARVEQDVRLVRWGAVGMPVLIFPTAGGDAEECERMGLIEALEPLTAAGRVKLYSVDSVAGRAWFDGSHPLHAAWLQNQFDAAIRHEIVPAIHADCRGEIDIITTGASIGAFNAVEVLCRHPDVFSKAVGMSGTYDLTRWLRGEWSLDFYFSSPLHYLTSLAESDQLDRLRSRFVVLATGTGDYEAPDQSWSMGGALGARGIPNRVDQWAGWSHDWPTWRAMLPGYLDELVE